MSERGLRRTIATLEAQMLSLRSQIASQRVTIQVLGEIIQRQRVALPDCIAGKTLAEQTMRDTE